MVCALLFLLGSNYIDVGWSRCGEIDIVEMVNTEGIKSGSQAYYFNGAYH